MKNIHILSTDKPSRLIYNDANQLCYQSNKSYKNDRKWMHRKKFNIYITSDVEIKLGEWVIYTKGIKIHCKKIDSKEDVELANIENSGVLKIILTTDQELIKNGIQPIPDDFLEWFVKNSSCERVEVKEKQHFEADKSKRIDPLNGVYYSYKIIIPKEEPKQEFTTVNGSSGCTITVTDEKGNPLTYWGGLEEPTQENNFFESLQKYFKETPREKVLEDWNKSAHLDNVGPTVEEFVENSNEERFKEAAELYLENVNTKVHKDLERDGWMKIGFISGAKSDAARDYWFEKFQEQDKNKYSDEDLREAFRQGHKSARTGSYNDITEQEDYNKWFSQFKKNEQ